MDMYMLSQNCSLVNLSEPPLWQSDSFVVYLEDDKKVCYYHVILNTFEISKLFVPHIVRIQFVLFVEMETLSAI